MKLTLKRAHKDSEYGRDHRQDAIAVDEHKCLLFLVDKFGRHAKIQNPERSVYRSLCT
jgi:hypothetical protein